ncbi:GbsR/MarR family transcriptional regulator [Mycolicibacterium sp. XJ870]
MADDDDVLDWVEQVAKYVWDQDRMPMIAGRIFAWLMICDPPEQTAGAITRAIGASRASLTNNLRLLSGTGFLEERTRPGDRAVYYRAAPQAFDRMIQRQIESMTQLRSLLQGGEELAGPTARGQRLRDAIEVFTWLEQALAGAPPLPHART